MPEVEVREQRLPGIGWRYEIPADERTLVLVVEDRGPRYLTLMGPEQDQPPTWEAKLSASTAAALAALLTGARVTTIATDERSAGP